MLISKWYLVAKSPMGLFRHLVTCIILPNYLREVWEAEIFVFQIQWGYPGYVLFSISRVSCFPGTEEFYQAEKQRRDFYGKMLAGCSGWVPQSKILVNLEVDEKV